MGVLTESKGVRDGINFGGIAGIFDLGWVQIFTPHGVLE